MTSRRKIPAKMLRNVLFAAVMLLASPALAAESKSEGGMVALKTLGAPIIENGRVNGQLRVTVKIVPETEEAGVQISARAQVWQSKLMASLNEFARLNVSIYRPVDATKLRAALLATLKAEGAKAKDIMLLDIVAY